MKVNNTKFTFLDKLFIVVMFWSSVFADLIFLAYMSAPNPYVLDFSSAINGLGTNVFIHLAILMLPYIFTVIMTPRGAKIYTIVISVFITAICMFYSSYYRMFNSFPSISMLELINLNNGDMPAEARFTLMPVMQSDMIYLVGLGVAFIVNFINNEYKFRNRTVAYLPPYCEKVEKVQQLETLPFKKAQEINLTSFKIKYAVVCAICIATIISLPLASACASQDLVDTKTFVQEGMAYTPLGAAIGDIGSILTPSNGLTDKEIEDIDAYFDWNSSLYVKSQYAGTLKNKNLIFIQLESLETFAINMTVDGVEVTPVLNRLAKSGYYFPNVHDQVKSGNSSDCDFMVTTSILPANRKVATRAYLDNAFNSLPKILNNLGYGTTYFCNNPNSNWGYSDFMPKVGYANLYKTYDFGEHNRINSYISDGAYYEQTLELIGDQESVYSFMTTVPQFAHLVCCSSHAPFLLPEQHITFNLPDYLVDTVLGNYIYAINYVDTQIGIFLQKLEAMGILDDTVVAMAGDHLGPNKYYPEELQQVSHPAIEFEGDSYDQTVPLIIYSGAQDVTPTTFNVNAGQIDIMPTLLDLLGVQHSAYANTAMGRSLVSSNVDFAIGSTNRVYGNPTDTDLKYITQAYKIANLLLENDYFA